MVASMIGNASDKLPFEAVVYLIHHIFLPSKLPHKDDFDWEYEMILVDTIFDALLRFKAFDSHNQNGIIDSVISMVSNLRAVHDYSTRGIDECKLRDALRHICKKGGTVLLHVHAQNTGVMISKASGGSIHVEVFELSPLNEPVIVTKGRLRRSFPGPAFSLNADLFEQPGFQTTVAHTLAKMAHQLAEDTQPKVKKAGQMHNESRDTTHPRIVTELFMGFLRSVSEPVDVNRIWKNTREEVMWRDSLRPWRRSSMWLLVRVAMQLVFARSTMSSQLPADLYKTFMVFLMSHVLELSHQHSLPSDLMYAMNAKLYRRLLKLKLPVDGPVLSSIQKAMRNTSRLINERWSDIVSQAERRYELSCLKCLDFSQDVLNTLPALDGYIRSMAERENNRSFDAFQLTTRLVKQRTYELPTCLSFSSEDYKAYNLKAFEAWVASDLGRWLETHMTDTSTCGELSNLIQSYHGAASSFYTDNPEATSIMLLTVLELWIACDKSTTSICELLKDYDPGVPQKLFLSLILPFKSQMERLVVIEDYLDRRRERAVVPAPRIFLDFGRETCFSVRYFDESPKHQGLLEQIKRLASQARLVKLDEFHQKKETYESLMQLHDQSDCEFEEVIDSYNGFPMQRHRSSCTRCGYKSKAEDLSIRVYEWPLPSNPLEERSTVFELQIPPFFGHWRDATVFVLSDVLKNEYVSAEPPRAKHPLDTYRALSLYFTPFSFMRRIGLLSQNKPHEVTHRRDKPIVNTTEEDVCLNNGLQYKYYDSTVGVFVDNFRLTEEIPTLCTYRLPAQASCLQRFLLRPVATQPNMVIASQSDCPSHMSLDEYKALSVIPLGYQTVWLNILLHLCIPSIDFKKAETNLVILQCIYRVGPRSNGNVIGTSHEFLNDEVFARRLLTYLHEASQRVKENWESSQALSTFISLATRLLSLTSAEQIKADCLTFLAGARAVAFDWVNLLRVKAHKSTNDCQRTDFITKAVEIALICVDSFNIDDRYLDDLLTLPENVSTFIQCSIAIQEGDYTITKSSQAMVRALHRRWEWLSYRAYPILAQQILENTSQGLDDALLKSWSAYQAGDGWRAASEQADHWLVSQTTLQGDSNPFSVHFNLLTGELLVKGHSLSRLPSKYERHPTYHTLFGNSALEVMPTAVPGMQFSGKNAYAGYILHLGIDPIPGTLGSQKHDLLVQAWKDNRTSVLIPSRVLQGEFPTAFVDKFVHWFDVTDGSLEFRPIEDPWTSSPRNWRLKRDMAEPKWRLIQEGTSLVYVKSKTAEVLSRILSPLEDPLRIHTVFHHASSSLKIELPKLQLGFQLTSGTSSIQSREFHGMAIDAEQALDTLVGLDNKLLLKRAGGSNRLLILPDGNISYEKNRDHVRVIIDKNSSNKVYGYEIDEQIGRLVDNGSLQSKLFLSYLHALTSFCLPDPLTQRTGTEQALSILKSAAISSFNRLAQENVDLLHKIARLTPERSYYPANERVMQTVGWSSKLSFLSQHGGFYKAVKSIFDQAHNGRIFHPESYVQIPNLNHVDWDLLERDCIRSSTFRVAGFGAEDHTVNQDTIYSARDRDQNSEQGFRAYVMASIIYQGGTSLQYDVPSDLGTHLWRFVSQSPESLGPDQQLPSELNYDGGLLQEASKYLSRYWSIIHQDISRKFSRFDRFHLMIWLSTLAFAKTADMLVIQTLASFFTMPEMVHISIPLISCFHLSHGAEVKRSQLRRIAQSACLPFHHCPEAEFSSHSWESKSMFKQRQQRQFRSSQSRAIDRLVNALMTQWPCETPFIADDDLVEIRTYVDVDRVMDGSRPNWRLWFDNYRFRQYLSQVGDVLKGRVGNPMERPLLSFAIPVRGHQSGLSFIDINDILACPAPSVPTSHMEDPAVLLSSSADPNKGTFQLAALIKRLEVQASSDCKRKYVKDLRESLLCLQDGEKRYSLQPMEVDIKDIILDHRSRCEKHVRETYQTIHSAAAAAALRHNPSAADTGVEQWPRLSPILFLQQLSRTRWHQIPSGWRVCIVQYGVALTNLQRAERLVSVYSRQADLIKELQNPGHTNWSPLEYPESLLLEIENGIMIREAQEQIAGKMRDPQSDGNAVMQLNMGEGKSSVIVPIVAAALADGSRLVRVIVAKPQSKQMFQMLVSKLGGFLDRRIYHMPFSRALKLGEAEADAIGSICRECMNSGGILLVQPEQILSLKLMGLECLISGKVAVGRSLLNTQEFFDTSSRDIVDESDENFSVKFELVYTMGMQRPVEFSPERWICIQQVLDLMKLVVLDMKESHFSMEVKENRPGSFPRTRVLATGAQQSISERVARHICETGLNGFPVARQPAAVRQTVFEYITRPNLDADEIALIENHGPGGFWTNKTRTILLLLRGLIAGGVLAFVFGQKRWRVNYGLDAARQPPTRLAVPYRAKDSPRPRSEFSHPEVVIILTSLSYYYGGLDDEEMFLAFDRLLKSDQADLEYQTWVKDAPDLPPAFRQLVGVNLQDRFQCKEQVFPPLCYSKALIDYYLAHMIFPKEMKEFPHKLSASGWDIGQIKTHPTTGFSGTNDSQRTLPLGVEHLDLQEQRHTNALVLEHLLQSENSALVVPPEREVSRSDTELLLAMVVEMEPPVQVILDVGAQILDFRNPEVAKEWLSMVPSHSGKQAVIFFDDSDELCILDREGHTEPLQTSSFVERLDECLVFLDEAHTRGTDLKLPAYYRALVTLGADLTKDRLVQACMRMRKLGKGQSVVFCIPQEIKTKILARTSKPSNTTIDVSDILVWAVSETWDDMKRSIPLWAQQGQRFERQRMLWAEIRDDGVLMSESQARRFLENESQTVEERYRPHATTHVSPAVEVAHNKNLQRILERCHEFDNLELGSVKLQEEQERELSPEIEQERQIQKPAPAQPAAHKIHPDLDYLIRTGMIINGSKAYKPAFETLRNTSAAAHLDVSQFPRDLLVTADFARTVQVDEEDQDGSYLSDDFQRPVQWILTSTAGHSASSHDTVDRMIIISPYEADQLLPLIRESRTAMLHIYTPRPNLSFRALDTLDLYPVPSDRGIPTLPRRLVVSLNLFSGQLYLGSFDEYIELCDFLNLAWNSADARPVAADGFILPDADGSGDRHRAGSGSGSESTASTTFTDSPVMFLNVLMKKIRRNCEEIDKTHLGMILDGRLIQPRDFRSSN